MKSTRLQPSTTERFGRRRVSTMIVAGTVAISGLGFATATPALASGGSLSVTLSQWSSADFALNDAQNTKVTIAAGIDRSGILGQKLTTTSTVSVKVDQSYCTVVEGGDVLVKRTMSTEAPVSGGVVEATLLGYASVKATTTANGTETKTPAGAGGDCNEVTGPPVTTSSSEQGEVNVKWSANRNSSPVVWADQDKQGVFYYRDATATGSATASIGSMNLGNSTSGWLWSGAWVYATE